MFPVELMHVVGAVVIVASAAMPTFADAELESQLFETMTYRLTVPDAAGVKVIEEVFPPL